MFPIFPQRFGAGVYDITVPLEPCQSAVYWGSRRLKAKTEILVNIDVANAYITTLGLGSL